MDLLERYRADVKSGDVGRRMQEIADQTGISIGTLRNIYYGQSQNPRYNNVERLRRYYADDASGGDRCQ
jgi:transcriptional regulator with XRE-family HTH domain